LNPALGPLPLLGGILAVLAFIHIPKTAGSTISTILRNSYCTRHCDIRLGDDFREPVLSSLVLRRIRWVHWRLGSIAGHGVVPHSDLQVAYPNIRFYTFLRDPLHRCASEYQYLVRRDHLSVPFAEWIQTDLARNRMTKKLCGREDADVALSILRRRVGFVGLTERFDESLLLLRSWLADPALDIRYRPKNVTRDNHIKNRLLRQRPTRQMLIGANREDLRLYDQVVRSIYPEQERAYGEGLSTEVQRFQASNVRPRPYPRQLVSLLLREMIYKPLAPTLARTYRPAA
jgi:hypothetical protein